MRTLRLLGNRVLVAVEARKWPVGQIYLVEKRRPSANARVVFVGEKVTLPLRVGQRVAFKPLAGMDYEWEGQRLRLLTPEDLLGILESDQHANVAEGL